MAWDFLCRRMRRMLVRNPIDGRLQPNLVGFHRSHPAPKEGRALVVFCHKWGSSYREFDVDLARRVMESGWIFLAPNFRGSNNSPQAGGSTIAQWDILAAIDQVRQQVGVDPRRVYLAGLSGGGYMALVMAGRFPDRFAAATVWSPIGNLVDWHRFHVERTLFYAYWKDIEAVTGGPPGTSPEVDQQYAERSPIHFIHAAAHLPIDINHGIHDGHQGNTIPIDQSIHLFNVIARALSCPVVTDDETRQLLLAGASDSITPVDRVDDADYGVPIYLRRQAGPARLTLFEGAHDMIVPAAYAWLKARDRQVTGEP